MAAYDVFKCNVCNQQTEKLVNQTHATLDRCDITYKCVGKLIKIGETSVKSSLSNTLDANLEAWKARTSPAVVQSSLTTPVSVSVMSGTEAITIAVPMSVYADTTSLTVSLKQEKLGVAPFTEYTYVSPSNTTQLYGQDDSSRRLTLRFTALDEVKVYVNGVELTPSQFNRSVAGRITLAEPLSDESSTIRVIVFQQAAPVVKPLTFTLNADHQESDSAWSNVTRIAMRPKAPQYQLFTCRDTSSLEIGTTLKITSVASSAGEIDTADVHLLLSAKPYSSYDRDLDNTIVVGTAITNATPFQYVADDVGVPTVFVNLADESMKSVFPPIAIITKSKDDIDNGLKNNSNTVIQNKYIT
jgi:hypothetical protein